MFVLVDKPQWWTSYDIVNKIHRLYPEEKVGHGWTLDPLASGLLVVAIGKDTKKLDRFLWSTKTYVTTIDFSVTTDTRDLQFRKEYTQRPVDHSSASIQIAGTPVAFPSLEQFHKALTALLWTHQLPLTPFSAKKVAGKKLYVYAREGKPLFIEVPMKVISFQILDYTFPQITVELEVGSGTYIRSIGYRLGKQFGLGWTLSFLRRTKVGMLEVPTKK